MTRVGIKIQDGCDNACTFCIVHKARGRAWSRDFDEIIAEASAYDRAGVKELVLTGINIGSYTHDGRDLTDVLETLLEKTDKVRYRISSIEPHDISEGLIDLVARAQGRICRHLHLPLQSGSDRILTEMHRPYDRSTYLALVQELYAKIPMMSLSTDVIVGFPSEDESDFSATLAVVSQCRFSKVHIFPYSKRSGTPAAERLDQIPSEIVKQRVERLRALSDKLRCSDLKRRTGTPEYVLVERQGRGTTESYHSVEVPHSAKTGEVLQIVL